jgi:hypothetical protein
LNQKLSNSNSHQPHNPIKCHSGKSGINRIGCTRPHAINAIPSILHDVFLTEVLIKDAMQAVVSFAREKHLCHVTHKQACELLTLDWPIALGIWQLIDVAHQEHDLLCFRTGALELICRELRGTFYVSNCAFSLQQQISMWLTAHIPMHVWCISCADQGASHGASLVPNSPTVRHPTMRLSVGVHILPAMSDTVNNLDFYNKVPIARNTYTDCLYHILSKALPRRCQIRELHRFIYRYTKTEPEVTMIVNRMSIVSILGLYPLRMKFSERMKGNGYETSANEQTDTVSIGCIVNFDSMVRVCSIYFRKPAAYEGCASCLPDQSLSDSDPKAKTNGNQPLLLFMIQQLLIYQVQLLPALWVSLNNNCNWSDVSDSVARIATRITQLWIKLPSCIENLDIAQSVSVAISGRDRTTFNTMNTRRNTLRDTIRCILDTYKKQMSFDKCSPSFDDRQLIYSTLKEVAAHENGELGSLDRLCGSRASAIIRSCHTDYSKIAQALLCLKQESIQIYYKVMHVLLTMYADLNVIVHQLPETIWAKHITAVNSKWKNVGGIQAHPQAATLLVCTGCHSVKVDYKRQLRVQIRASSEALKSCTAPIDGCVYVTVDDDNERLLCNSHKKKAASVFTDSEHTRQSMYKATTALHCGHFPLSRIHLIGNTVWVGDMQYSICTSCACIMEVGKIGSSKANTNLWKCYSCSDLRSTQSICGVCARTYKNKHQMETMCFYTPDGYDPLIWKSTCTKCAVSYRSLYAASKVEFPFTTDVLHTYAQVSRCQAEYHFFTTRKNTKRNRD